MDCRSFDLKARLGVGGCKAVRRRTAQTSVSSSSLGPWKIPWNMPREKRWFPTSGDVMKPKLRCQLRSTAAECFRHPAVAESIDFP